MWKHWFFGNGYRVFSLSKSYLTAKRIILQRFKDNSNMLKLTISIYYWWTLTIEKIQKYAIREEKQYIGKL